MTADETLRDYYAARAPEYDDWYLRRGRYSHGTDADAHWAAELHQAATWLRILPIGGEVVELAAGTGWWSVVLASMGALWIYDANDEPLAIARDRLAAAGLTASSAVRDAWAEPDRRVDALFMGFWLSHVPRTRLSEFLDICLRWLEPGGTVAFIDSRRDPSLAPPTTPRRSTTCHCARLGTGSSSSPRSITSRPSSSAPLPEPGSRMHGSRPRRASSWSAQPLANRVIRPPSRSWSCPRAPIPPICRARRGRCELEKRHHSAAPPSRRPRRRRPTDG